MNERIRELAKQCWNERWEGQLHFDNEKFAELIVLECAEIGDKTIIGSDKIGKTIKQHFGVKQ